MKRAIIWGLGTDFSRLWKYYELEIDKESIEIIGLIGIAGHDFPAPAAHIPIIPREQIKEQKFDYLIVSSSLYHEAIYQEALELGVRPRKIIDGMMFSSSRFDFRRLPPEDGNDIDFVGNEFRMKAMCAHKRIFRGMYGTRIALGINSYVISAVVQGHVVPDCDRPNVEIGNFSSIGGHVSWEMGMGINHDFHAVSTSPYFFEGEMNFGGNIVIGSDVWIGKGCHLKSSHIEHALTIGDGAVVASDSVVAHDVPPYAIVGGNPARIIKYRFPEPMIEAFGRIRWWDWDKGKIEMNRRYFCDPDVFVKKFDI